MDAYFLQGHSLDSIIRKSLPEPLPGPGEVAIDVRAASVNYRDYALATGGYQANLERPFVPVSDGVGIVKAVGPSVDTALIGRRVVGLYTTEWQQGSFRHEYHASKLGGPLDGWLRQIAVLPASAVLEVPVYLSDAEASTLPVSGLTAWTAMQWLSPLAGERILIQGTGNVSLMALQIAAIKGMEVIATTGDPEKEPALRKMGAHHVINYRERTDLANAIREVTDGRGVDHVIDVVGGQPFFEVLNAAADNAKIAIIGFLKDMKITGDLIGPIISRQLNLHGVSVGSHRSFAEFLGFLETHRIRPVVGKTYAFDNAVAAIEAMGMQRRMGKPVILFPART